MRAGQLDSEIAQPLDDLIIVLRIRAEADVLQALRPLPLENLAPTMRIAERAQVGATAHPPDIESEIGVELDCCGKVGNAEDESVKRMHGGRRAVPAGR